jgi:hypothetical protein
MPLQKQPISINFSQGLDTKSDPYQVALGNFLALQNSVFTKAGLLKKRNGFDNITQLPNAVQTTLTTLNDNLIATGSDLYAFSSSTNQWLNQGIVQPVQLSVQPLVRTSTSQTAPDAALATNGLSCLAYTDTTGISYYQITDTVTGQQIVNQTALPATAVNARVFTIGVYFVITYIATILGTPTLQYISIPTATPAMPQTPVNISASVASINAGYDGSVFANVLYISWGASGGAVRIATLNQSLALSAALIIPASVADLMSVTVDGAANRVWISYWDSGSTNGYSASFTLALGAVVSPTVIITGVVVRAITSLATNGVLNVFYETVNTYSYAPNASSDYISTLTVTPPIGVGPGTPSAATVILRSVGLVSKAFMSTLGVIYMIVAYGDIDQTTPSNDSNQSTYFLVDSTGAIYMRLASTNAGGYSSTQVLSNVSLIGDNYYTPYLFADFLTTVNKGTNLPVGTPVSAIYTQYGINMAKFSLNITNQQSSQIAGSLHLTGGQLWQYDGVKPVEQGFHVYPENAAATTATGSGNITAGTYYYVFTYEWTDAAGNLHRSAASIPTVITTTTASSTNTVKVPTNRLTYKTGNNPIRIVGYRWSVAQQVYYQFTSVTAPVLNDSTVDFVTITDTLADSEILGQTPLYTNGGVIENISAPASIDSCLFNNRLFLINAEDPNVLSYSKQVISATPVEMSDLLTIYVAPTTGAQGSTGPMRALGAMDDKLIIFKDDAVYYLNGNGPDNTGSNNSFSETVFITGTVGCANPNSVVLTPNGIMFQSDKGIWLLGRDLSTTYIGAPVEQYNTQTVVSATTIPGTNEVRFTLDNNITLMYDYFYGKWSTHTNVSSISATLYQGLHTYLNSYGKVYQETPGVYTDGSTPVLMSLTTSWINVAGLQGYERFYFGYLLGTYYTPFKLDVQLAYDYNSSASQSIQITPDNYTKPWGGEAQWGSGGPWGGVGNVFEARFFPSIQKCESFQVTIKEIYDASLGVSPGQGLTLSGLNLMVGLKKGNRTQSAKRSFG